MRTWIYWPDGRSEIVGTDEQRDAAYVAGAADTPAAFTRDAAPGTDGETMAARADRIADIETEIDRLRAETPEVAEQQKRRGRRPKP